MTHPSPPDRVNTHLPGPAAAETAPGRLEDILAFLSEPRHYPDQPETVEVVQTHMSWVFMTPNQVFKFKKPVRSAYFDFRTLNARRLNCLDEVRLNRRLAPDVYYGVVPVTWDKGEGYRIGGHGTPVEWLVHMRRLPNRLMLDRLIHEGAVHPAEIQTLGQILVAFYQRAQVISWTAQDYQRRYRNYLEEQVQELLDPQYRLPQEALLRVGETLKGFVEDSSYLRERAEKRRILEAHGDLRPEHVCLTHPPVIIDCLEFSADLRSLDPIDELAFFSIECEREGAGHWGEQLMVYYQESTGDRVAPSLCHFYKAYRALLRAKLSAWHLKDPGERRREHWQTKAHYYLAMASFQSDFLAL